MLSRLSRTADPRIDSQQVACVAPRVVEMLRSLSSVCVKGVKPKHVFLGLSFELVALLQEIVNFKTI